MNYGWVCLHRKIRESPVFQDAEMLKLWILCLVSANHQDALVKVDGLAKPVLVKRGQFITGRYALHAEYYKRKRKSNKSAISLWRWLETLRDMGNLNIETNSRFSLVTIVNYETYQKFVFQNDQANEPPVISRRSAGDQPTITNNNENKKNNVNNENKSSTPKLRFEDADMETARWMFSLNKELLPDDKEPNFEAWANTIRLMRERDNRTPEAIRDLYEYAHNDSFWKSNVRCPDKLREQWATLTIQKGTRKNGKSYTPGPGQLHPADAASNEF